MLRRFALMSGIAVLASSTLLADFSYQETSTITGGMIAKMMKFAGMFSKRAREPMQSTIAVKGNKMMHRSADTASVIDLDAQTITTINFQKRTYSVMTFEQMKEMLAQISEKMKQQNNNGQMQFKVSAKATGATRQISGYDTKEMVVKMEMEATDQQSGQKGAMVITTDMWLAPNVQGYGEVRDFYKRMSEKIAWTPGQNAFMMNPQVSQGMAEVYKEAAKLDGVPVLQTITMGGANENAGASAGTQQAAAQQPSQEQESEKPSMTEAVGGALAGHFGFGHRKHPKQQDQEQAEQQPPAQGGGSDAGTLLEMNVESANFSSGPVDDSLFAVPAGFRQIEPDTRRMPQ